MASYRYNGYEYNLTSFFEFVNEFNIRNDDIANQKNLNKAVNQLKRELNQVIGQLKILTAEESIRWNNLIEYQPGEIVSYFPDSKVTHTKTEIENSFYLALPNTDTNKNKYPSDEPKFWKNITLAELYPDLEFKNFVMKNKETADWDAYQDYAVVNIKKLTDTINNFKTSLSNEYDEKYISFNNSRPMTVANANNAASKKYVDQAIKASEEANDITGKMGQYIKLTSNNKMTCDNVSENEAYKTPNTGFVPGMPNYSSLGNSQNRFKDVYATSFIGTATRAKYADVAEYFESDKKFDRGSILTLSPKTGEFELYQPGDEIFGVVSTRPGVILNADAGENGGILIAHKGKVPVKIYGKALRGQIIIAYRDGMGCAVDSLTNENRHLKIGICLEDSQLAVGKVNVKI